MHLGKPTARTRKRISNSHDQTSKLYEQLLANPNAIISFSDLDALFHAFRFRRPPGQRKPPQLQASEIAPILTAQPRGKDAVPYQVKRLLAVIKEYDLHISE